MTSRKRAAHKRNRPKRRTGKGGGSVPNRSQMSLNDRMKQVGDRVDTATRILDLDHMGKTKGVVKEGEHYSVLAYTDWANKFVPTVIKWNHGAVDDLSDRKRSIIHLENALFPHKRYVAEVWSNLDDGVYSVTVEARNLEEAHEKGSQKLREKHSEHGSDITVYEADTN